MLKFYDFLSRVGEGGTWRGRVDREGREGGSGTGGGSGAHQDSGATPFRERGTTCYDFSAASLRGMPNCGETALMNICSQGRCDEEAFCHPVAVGKKVVPRLRECCRLGQA